jgi:hypothetical protein
MQAIQLDEWGPPTCMPLQQVPVPAPTPDQPPRVEDPRGS